MLCKGYEFSRVVELSILKLANIILIMKYSRIGQGKVITSKDYSKEILFTASDLPGKGHLLQIVTIPPNTKQRLHFHDYQTEVFYILEGECSIYFNEEWIDAKPGDAFICSPGDKHNLWNKTDRDFKLIVFKIDLPENDDTHWSE